MSPLIPCYAMLAVSVLYCVWYQYRAAQLARQKALRQGVARLLWAAAMGDDE